MSCKTVDYQHLLWIFLVVSHIAVLKQSTSSCKLEILEHPCHQTSIFSLLYVVWFSQETAVSGPDLPCFSLQLACGSQSPSLSFLLSVATSPEHKQLLDFPSYIFNWLSVLLKWSLRHFSASYSGYGSSLLLPLLIGGVLKHLTGEYMATC